MKPNWRNQHHCSNEEKEALRRDLERILAEHESKEVIELARKLAKRQRNRKEIVKDK